MSPGFPTSFSKPILDALSERGFVSPTPIQEKAIPHISSGKNLLLIAPTGHGKTEAAVLPIFDELIRKRSKGIRLIYITPLRALNRDILIRMEWWCKKLDISLGVRHGDTEVRERSKQSSIPPEILITTPETFQAILVGRVMRGHLKNVRWVIVDEVHELIDNKRGSQLAVALERLRGLATFQTIGLSATTGNPEKVAEFLSGSSEKCDVATVSMARGMDIDVFYPTKTVEDEKLSEQLYTYPEVVARLRTIKGIVEAQKSTIIFTNTRSIAETLSSRFRVWGVDGIGVHHGSLSKPTRMLVENDLKNGGLKAVISTSSLELGIDVGDLDCIIQYNSPREVTRTLQRIGRSGHSIEKKPRGYIIVENCDDFFESVVIARRALEETLEPPGIPEKPYDVLMHQIAGLLLERRRITFEETLRLLKGAYPYRDLEEEELVRVLEYMMGVYPKFLWYSGEERIIARARVRERLYNYYFKNLSMIPETRHYLVIERETREPIGLLDEAFVLNYGEIGRKFIEAGSPWEIEYIGKERIYVKKAEDAAGAIPSWSGEEIPVPFDVAQEVGRARGIVEECVKNKRSPFDELNECYPFDRESMMRGIDELEEHAAHHPVPTDRRVVIEYWEDYTIVHSCLGTKQNRMVALMLSEDESLNAGIDPYRIVVRGRIERGMVEKAFSKKMTTGAVSRTGMFRRNFIITLRKFGGLEKRTDLTRSELDRVIRSYEKSVIWEEALKTTLFKDYEAVGRDDLEFECAEGLSPLGREGLESISRKYDVIKPERMDKLINEYTKARLMNEAFTFLCCDCYSYTETLKIKNFTPFSCPECGSDRIGFIKEEQHRVEMDILRGKDEGIKREANENFEFSKSFGRPFLIVMASSISRERGLKILSVIRDENSLIPAILREERRALKKRFR